MAPSQVFLGLTRGKSLFFPIFFPVKYAAVSLIQAVANIESRIPALHLSSNPSKSWYERILIAKSGKTPDSCCQLKLWIFRMPISAPKVKDIYKMPLIVTDVLMIEFLWFNHSSNEKTITLNSISDIRTMKDSEDNSLLTKTKYKEDCRATDARMPVNL